MALDVVAFAGGVGGAKLADGLYQVLPPENLTIVVNTGDDFEHLGLHISPDIDTVVYTLAGLASPGRGWGRAQETWQALEVIDQLGGPVWFRLGDKDLGLHLWRTTELKAGQKLSQVTDSIRRSLGVSARVLPMSDHAVRTLVESEEGLLPFQEYFVAHQFQPEVEGFIFEGAALSKPSPGVLEAIKSADLIVFCPSNPWVSLDPILSVPGIKEAITEKLVLAVSPIIRGRALKGPAAKMYRELGFEPAAHTVAHHYDDVLTGFVFDEADSDEREVIAELGVVPRALPTIMTTQEERIELARQVLAFAADLRIGAAR